jgi:hypothetical protein
VLENRKIICPAIYRNFKQNFYATMGISIPRDIAFLNSISDREDCELLQARDTEDQIMMTI